MAYTARVFTAPATRVFAALLDPETYPAWLAGAEEIRAVDEHWPRVGSRFHHRVGLGPLTLTDATEVVEVRPPELLVLHARARPIVSAYATFRVVPTTEATFRSAVLDRSERDHGEHAAMLAWYRELVALRRAGGWSDDGDATTARLDGPVLIVERSGGAGALHVHANLSDDFVLVQPAEGHRVALASGGATTGRRDPAAPIPLAPWGVVVTVAGSLA